MNTNTITITISASNNGKTTFIKGDGFVLPIREILKKQPKGLTEPFTSQHLCVTPTHTMLAAMRLAKVATCNGWKWYYSQRGKDIYPVAFTR